VNYSGFLVYKRYLIDICETLMVQFDLIFVSCHGVCWCVLDQRWVWCSVWVGSSL